MSEQPNVDSIYSSKTTGTQQHQSWIPEECPTSTEGVFGHLDREHPGGRVVFAAKISIDKSQQRVFNWFPIKSSSAWNDIGVVVVANESICLHQFS